MEPLLPDIAPNEASSAMLSAVVVARRRRTSERLVSTAWLNAADDDDVPRECRPLGAAEPSRAGVDQRGANNS
ncbi:unnamed protein product [Heligmosomoides polygyrus]|uniref:Uncharacterized protein n=1 Tax=Heligmosomoides polygyrus TaxID=6339 RepID=A0A183G1N1_HELPZ|nr:unnamed protein product [Heligmosomoides polygyrus]